MILTGYVTYMFKLRLLISFWYNLAELRFFFLPRNYKCSFVSGNNPLAGGIYPINYHNQLKVCDKPI